MTQNVAIGLFIIFSLYVGYMRYLFGPIHSISESWYKLNQRKPEKGILFTIFCWLLGAGIIVFVDNSGSDWGGLFFLSGAGISFTGAAAAFKSKGAHTNTVHYIGAVVAIVAALLGLGLSYGIWWPWYIAGVTSGVLWILRISKILKNPIYWIEIACFLSIIMGLLMI